MNFSDAAAVKTTVDSAAIVVLISTIANLLPHIASLLTVIWMVLRIWETETVQRWTGRKD